MINDLLNLRVGSSKKKVTITDIGEQDVGENNPNKRFFLRTQSDDGAEYKVNEVWVRDHNKKIVVKGLWLNFDSSGDHLLSTSLLAKFLKFMGVSTPGELKGKEITLEPKENGFMAIVAYDE